MIWKHFQMISRFRLCLSWVGQILVLRIILVHFNFYDNAMEKNNFMSNICYLRISLIIREQHLLLMYITYNKRIILSLSSKK